MNSILSLNRYLAILYPLPNKSRWFSRKCHIILSIGWLFGGVVGYVSMAHTTTVPFQWNSITYYDCRSTEMDELTDKIYMTSVFILTFALPLFIQIYCYISIGRKLLRDKLINNKLPLRRSTQDNDRAKVFICQIILSFIWVFSVTK